MKTPQEILGEIARRRGHQSWNDPKQPCLCALCPLLREAVKGAQSYGDARAEEARMEALREAEVLAERLGHDCETLGLRKETSADDIDALEARGLHDAAARYRYVATKIRALASQPKAEPTRGGGS